MRMRKPPRRIEADDDGAEANLRQAVGEAVATQRAQLRRADFQADQEEQQDDTDFRDFTQIVQHLVGNVAKLAHDQPGDQKRHDRAKPSEGKKANCDHPEQPGHCGQQSGDIEMGQSTAPEMADPCSATTPDDASADRQTR